MTYEKPKFQRRKVVVDEGFPDVISMLLRDKLDFMDFDYIDMFPFMNQTTLDEICQIWHEVVEKVRSGEEVKIFRNFPTGPGALKGQSNVKYNFV